MAITSDDYFSDKDYLTPGSPDLQPVQVNWKSGKRGLSDELSSDDDELDLNSPWAADIFEPRKTQSPNKFPRVESSPGSENDRVTRALLNVMGNGIWTPGGPELKDLAIEWHPSPALDIIPAAPAQASLQPVPIRETTRRKEKKRFALPIIIDGETESVAVMACPDTGSFESIIPLELAKQLGLQVSPVEESFALANGKVVKSLGIATVRCSFGTPGVVKAEASKRLKFTVHVFETLAVPAIIGSSFLDETETFTKHRDRLVEQRVTALQSLRVCSIGKPRKGLVCRLDSFVGCANADTGSDLDLVSPKFVHQRGLKIRDDIYMILEFADGSTGRTRGSIDVRFAIGNVDNERGFVPRGSELDLEFFILDDLTSDILVGQDTLEEMHVISENGDLVIDSVPQPGLSDCNIIRHIGSVERTAISALRTVKKIFSRQDTHSPSLVVDIENPEDDLIAMQRENARREAEATGAAYKCEFPDCTAPPFQAQYLLNSHANIHSSARPHHCPVDGCPRGQGGKGFKRKNEMIRHRLVHEMPGYVCPFCPDGEQKYPRPDNLQRHVRVHHSYDKDDPLLRAVLAERPEGTNRDRRRRGLYSSNGST